MAVYCQTLGVTILAVISGTLGFADCAGCGGKMRHLGESYSSLKDTTSARACLDLARIYLDTAEEDKARDLAVKHWNCTSVEVEIHRGWGEVCEELGMARQARHCYGEALKLNPDDTESLYRLGRLSTETGHYEDALRYLKKVLRSSPDHREASALLVQNYRLLGFDGLAEALAPDDLSATPSVQPRSFPPAIGKKETERFLALFSGKEVGYALQEICTVTGETRFVFHDAPLNHDLVAAHILGTLTLGVYPLRSDNTVRFAALSIRLPSRVVRDNIRNTGYLGVLREQLRSHAFVILRFIRGAGLHAYIEECGEYEYRAWIFFKAFVHFLKVKRFISLLMERLPRPPGNVTVESVSATRPAGIGWVEHPVMLPLGLRRKTLKRSLFLDEDTNAYGNQLAFLHRIRAVPLDRLAECLRRNVEPATFPGRKNRPPSAKLLIDRCPVIGELAGKAERGAILRRDEKVILFYTVGLVHQGAEALHGILESCPDYNYEKVKNEAARLKPRPVSCVKIRQLAPEITASLSCSCAFDLRGDKYPSPLLHIDPNLVPASGEFSLHGQISAKDAARRYINLLAHIEETRRAKARIEAFLDKQFLRKGIDRVRVDKTLLRRTIEDGIVAWKLER